MKKYKGEIIVNECDEIDLNNENVSVVTNNENFKGALSKWLFNKNYNLIGNVLSEIDDIPDKLEIFNENSRDYLYFSCLNSSNEPLIICLLDGSNDNQKYLMVLKNKDEDYVYRLDYVDNKVIIFGDKTNKVKKHSRKIAV